MRICGEWIRENVWGCLDWGTKKWICEDDLLKFVSDEIVKRKFRNYFKGVKCKFTNLPLLLKNILIIGYGILFCVGLS